MSDAEYEFEYDGWTALTDFSEMSADDLKYQVIDSFIHLAAKTGLTVIEEIAGCLQGAVEVRVNG